MKRKNSPGMTRRGLFNTLVALPVAAKVAASFEATAAAKGADVAQVWGHDSIYTRLLRIRPLLSIRGHTTTVGGSRMPPEVLRAMAEANDYFVDMFELNKAAGRRIAEVMGAEDALVTAGAFSAMVVGAAACLTGTDPEKIEALPHPTWPKRECLTQDGHRFVYDRAYRAGGAALVSVETKEQLINAINEKTAFLAVLASVERRRNPQPGLMMPHEFVEIGKRAGVPVLIDAASELPPAENLTRYTGMGADLVAFSGGKGLLGPQSAGILAGRKDLIEAATLNLSPNTAIGRGMKVGKEEIVGMVVALNLYISRDQGAVIEKWDKKAQYIVEQLQDIPGLQVEFRINTQGFGDIAMSWDREVIPFTGKQVAEMLNNGEPRIIYYDSDEGGTLQTRNMKDGEEIFAARRLRQFFTEESRARQAGWRNCSWEGLGAGNRRLRDWKSGLETSEPVGRRFFLS